MAGQGEDGDIWRAFDFPVFNRVRSERDFGNEASVPGDFGVRLNVSQKHGDVVVSSSQFVQLKSKHDTETKPQVDFSKRQSYSRSHHLDIHRSKKWSLYHKASGDVQLLVLRVDATRWRLNEARSIAPLSNARTALLETRDQIQSPSCITDCSGAGPRLDANNCLQTNAYQDQYESQRPTTTDSFSNFTTQVTLHGLIIITHCTHVCTRIFPLLGVWLTTLTQFKVPLRDTLQNC